MTQTHIDIIRSLFSILRNGFLMSVIIGDGFLVDHMFMERKQEAYLIDVN